MWYDEKSGQWYSVRNSQDVAVIIRECFSESLADIIEDGIGCSEMDLGCIGCLYYDMMKSGREKVTFP